MAAKRDDPYFVYALLDPDTQRIRWIGVTQNPAIRHRGLSSGFGISTDGPLAEWIASLHREKRKPGFKILVELRGDLARAAAFAAEIKLIGFYARLCGGELLNVVGNPRRTTRKSRKRIA